MPAADHEDSGQFTSGLISSIRRTMRNILERADATGVPCLEDSDWVDGWQAPLREATHRSISRRSSDVAASLTQIVDTFFAALDTYRSNGTRAPVVQ